LFEALSQQGVSTEYCSLLALLYDEQVGTLGDHQTFPILRGVRQGDVLSTLLFNAASEMVMRRWKARLIDHGILLSNGPPAERLTNIRFADDLIIYANSLEELTCMLEMLVEEFKAVGLELNAKKSKIFTLNEATVASDIPLLIEVADGFIEVVRKGSSHVYLGCTFSGDLRDRGRSCLAGRLQCAWAKFHLFRHSLTNKHVDLRLRLRLFEAVVRPCALYSLAAAPLTACDIEKLDVAYRKMLRQIVGYTKTASQTWHEAGSRMKHKLEQVSTKFALRSWSLELTERKQKLYNRVISSTSNPILHRTFLWSPKLIADSKLEYQPFRARGRPRASWHQYVTMDA